MSKWLQLNNGTKRLAAGEFSERVIEKLISRYLTAGQLGVDCGAADGRMIEAMLNAQGGGVVLAFEPIPKVFELLISRFNQPHVLIRQACVSDHGGCDASFFHVKDRRWISSLSPDQISGYDVEEIVVRMTTIDDEIKMIPVSQQQPVGFIKLDIEGGEFRALQGAKNTLFRDQPFVVFENSLATAACSFEYTQAEFFAFFSELGYELLDVFGTPLTLNRWQGSGRSELCWNFVAAHKNDARLADFRGCIDGLLDEVAASTCSSNEI